MEVYVHKHNVCNNYVHTYMHIYTCKYNICMDMHVYMILFDLHLYAYACTHMLHKTQ